MNTADKDCIFCRIVAKQLSSPIIYEDDELIAFHDIKPVAAVHFLIIPKVHIASLAACTEEQRALLGKMMLLAPILAQEQGCCYQIDAASGRKTGGFKLACNTGPDAGQIIYHLHIHVMGGIS